jgi:hypothetical protein
MSDRPVDLTLLQTSLAQSQKHNALLEEQIAKATSDSQQSTADKIAADVRIPKLEGMVDVLKLFPSFLLAAVALSFTVIVALLGFVIAQVVSVERRVDSTNGRLAEEFRTMRAEMAAQTSAIANSITATRQVQPQILVVPMPEAPPKPQQ